MSNGVEKWYVQITMINNTDDVWNRKTYAAVNHGHFTGHITNY